MKLKYQAQKRTRIKSRFTWIYTQDNLWFVNKTKKWEKLDFDYITKKSNKTFSSVQYCHSVRAFRKKLKQMPNGVKFILSSNFVGYDVYGIGSKK